MYLSCLQTHAPHTHTTCVNSRKPARDYKWMQGAEQTGARTHKHIKHLTRTANRQRHCSSSERSLGPSHRSSHQLCVRAGADCGTSCLLSGPCHSNAAAFGSSGPPSGLGPCWPGRSNSPVWSQHFGPSPE